MKKTSIKDLTPGMYTASPVYSKNGQLIIPEHTQLTTQQIFHLEFYGIEWVSIIPEEEVTDSIRDSAGENINDDLTSYSQKLKRSREFHEFKVDYNKKTRILETSLNDIITKNAAVDAVSLLSQVSSLYQNQLTSLSVFDMLHNMRQVDDSTYAHSINVALISRMMGKWLELPEDDLDVLTTAGLLYDIGKCMIPVEILQKPGPLTADEYDEVKKHTILGTELLEHQNLDSRIKTTALLHHERCDGSGYPMRYKTDQIPYFAKIIAIADVYDAMTSDRCYRKGLCPFEVITIFEREGFVKFDPTCLFTFLTHIIDTFMGNCVLLNDGSFGKIIFINKQSLSRPVIRTAANEYLDLAKHPELYIQAII